MKKYCILFLFSLAFIDSMAQNVQNIKGTVIDKNTQQPLIGAYIMLSGSESTGGITDIDGKFLVKDVPVGRISLISQYVGYETWQSGSLELTSAKELIVNIELSPSVFTMDTLVIRPQNEPGETSNEFTAVSGRSFSPEDAQRYAGSINDPGRMAVSLPGVQFGQQDNQNTMVVRANSPYGISWRLEGMEIPNPNHFADVGSSGGGISALSIFVLGKSDFLSGAFAPQYGNAYSGVVDMNFRKGNTENREHRFQFGIIGIDFASEGPFKKGNDNNSYLFNYRYSTLGILSKMGIRVVKPNVSNTFQDLSFNMYFKLSKKTSMNIFSLGGLSTEMKDPDSSPETWDDFRQYYYPTKLGVTGVKVKHLVNNKSFIDFSLSTGFNSVAWEADSVDNNLNPSRLEEEYYKDTRVASSLIYSTELNKKTTLQAGTYLTFYNYDVEYNRLNFETEIMNTFNQGKGSTLLTEGFIQSQYRATRNLTLMGGIHAQTLSLNGTNSFEPRASIQYAANNGISAAVSYGKHSRILPFNFYETVISDPGTNNIISRPNKDLEMMKAHHYVLMLQKSFQNNVRLRVEPYIQQLNDVPVSTNPNSTYSMINQDDFFQAENLDNTGEGLNKGVDVTIEKYFNKGLFFLLATSFYDSKYKTNNGGEDTWYSTRYNGNRNISVTTGKEWKLANDRMFEFGGRMMWGGGLRYSPIDKATSQQTGWPVSIEDQAFTLQTQDYFRLDLRFAYRSNKPGKSWKLSLDIQNATNRQNVRRPVYDRVNNEIRFDPQSSLVPAISYTLDF